MLLRPRQKQFVERSVRALEEHGNTLAIAPTGAGKTIMLSAVTGKMVGDRAKACVLAHRDELTDQNREKFARVNPHITTSVVDAKDKSWNEQVTFAMVPTLARPANLAQMPTIDLLVIDEAHHAAADTYRRIIDATQERNPDCKVYGVTATPHRGDKCALRPVFSNVADQIKIGELIASGHLVPPRTFVIDPGVQDQLTKARRTADDFDMAQVAEIMDTTPITEAVIRHWLEKADDRQTVVFCSTVEHARNVTDAFNAAGIAAGLIYGDMPATDRKETLDAYAARGIRVVVNVAVLTEGWDHPPTSCVVLLRPSSYKSTMIQMIGRGLRTVSPEEYPGVIKTDCIVLDFGTSSLIHGTLEQDVDLNGRQPSDTAQEQSQKQCPGCGASVPNGTTECPLCDHIWEMPGAEKKTLGEFVMTEIDLLYHSNFRWCDIFNDDTALIATGFNAWGGVFFRADRWHGIGGRHKEPPHMLAVGDRTICLAAANDWLNEYETNESAFKTNKWLNQPPTDKQLKFLAPKYKNDFGLTRYHASALLVFRFNRRRIHSLISSATTRQAGEGKGGIAC